MQQRAQEILEFAEMEEFKLLPVKGLSSGMKARLGFAIATDVQPDILILDEVLSVGDEHFKMKCKKRIDGFWQGNTTILVVSHDLDFIRQYCERVIWLDRGKLMFEGEPQETVNRYLEYTA